jgi:hypothetical protein
MAGITDAMKVNADSVVEGRLIRPMVSVICNVTSTTDDRYRTTPGKLQ